MKNPSSNLRRTCCVQKLFLTLRTIFVYNMFSPCSAKKGASDKDLPVLSRTVHESLIIKILFSQIYTNIQCFSQGFLNNRYAQNRHRFLNFFLTLDSYALSFYLTKTVLVGPKWFWSDQIDLDLTIMIWPKENGHNQNELVRSKLWFSTKMNHNLDLTNSFWS